VRGFGLESDDGGKEAGGDARRTGSMEYWTRS
jgi:hypothetical protein